MKIIYLSLLLGAASAIKVEKVSPSQVKVKQGGSFAVTCTADDWYEVSLIFVLQLKNNHNQAFYGFIPS